MELFIGIAIISGIWWFISNNKKSIKDETIIKTTQTVKIAGGEQTIERTTVLNHDQTTIRSPSTPITPPIHKIITPTVEETNLQRQLEEARQHELEAKQLIEKLSNQPKPTSTTIQIPDKKPQLKKCANCERTQPTSEFRSNHKQPDGLTKWCISCLDSGEKLINPASLKGIKFCPKCQENRRKTSFYPTPKYPDGLSKWCKFCLSKR